MNRIRKSLATAVAALALTATGLVTAAPAQAATSTSFCFTWSQTGAPYANHNVELWSVDGAGNWVSRLRTGKTGSNGCGTFYSTPSHLRLRVHAYTATDWHAWSGATPYIANAGSGGANLGRGWVYPLY